MIRILDKKRKLDKDTRFDALDGHHFTFNCKWEGQTVVKHPPRFVASALKRAFAHEPFWRALVVDGDRVAVTCSTPAGLEQVKTKFAELWAVVQRPPHTKLFITNIGNLHTVHVKAALSLYGKVTFFTRFGSAQGDVDTFFGDSASVGLLPRPDIDGIESSIEYEVVGAGVFTFNVARAETKDERLARLSRAKEVKAAEKVEHDGKDDPPSRSERLVKGSWTEQPAWPWRGWAGQPAWSWQRTGRTGHPAWPWQSADWSRGPRPTYAGFSKN